MVITAEETVRHSVTLMVRPQWSATISTGLGALVTRDTLVTCVSQVCYTY